MTVLWFCGRDCTFIRSKPKHHCVRNSTPTRLMGGEKGADRQPVFECRPEIVFPSRIRRCSGRALRIRSIEHLPSRHPPVLRLGASRDRRDRHNKAPPLPWQKKNTRNETADDHHDHRIQVMAFCDSNSAGGVRFDLLLSILGMYFVSCLFAGSRLP